jgi:hypothetical protein
MGLPPGPPDGPGAPRSSRPAPWLALPAGFCDYGIDPPQQIHLRVPVWEGTRVPFLELENKVCFYMAFV